MTSPVETFAGGCQCGTLRFRASHFGRASLCHCRMCQKATGGIGGLFVTAKDLEWTRGAPKHFASSNVARRGFCSECGTPLTFETAHAVDLSIAAFDRAAEFAPVIQLAVASRLTWSDDLHRLPTRSVDDQIAAAARETQIVSHQHPDHDTDVWIVRK